MERLHDGRRILYCADEGRKLRRQDAIDDDEIKNKAGKGQGQILLLKEKGRL
jgi:hypothetical protein